MLKDLAEIIKKGDESGNDMIFKIKTPDGLEIFGLATKNYYGGEWDLGPTWNYLVLAEEPFLVDTGRIKTSRSLLEMIETTGINIKDIKSILLTHGHEDHDGGLADLVKRTGASVRTHSIYDRLIRHCPEKAPEGINKNFPPCCWHCVMPESFTHDNCLEYHTSRQELVIEDIEDVDQMIGEGIQTYYLPGHSPDAVAIALGSGAFIVGDNILPQISPAPSKEESFELLNKVLGSDNQKMENAFGLKAYLRSLKKMKLIGKTAIEGIVLPGHRVFFHNQWNDINLDTRVDEIINHHIERCGDIIDIIDGSEKSIPEIVIEYFDESTIKGLGFNMGMNEITSHLELLVKSQDVNISEAAMFSTTGGQHFEPFIRSLKPF